MEKLIKFMRSWQRTVALLVLLLLATVVVRLPELRTVVQVANVDGPKIFWYDETLSLFYAQQSWGDFWRVIGFDTSPPLFYLLLWTWFWRFGFSGVAFLPMLFSVAGVAAVYFLGKEFFNKKVGLLAGLFFAVSPLAVDYSAELRAYSLLALGAALAMLFWWRLVNEWRARNFILYLLFAAMAAYSHYTALALIGAQAIMFQIVGRSWKKTLGVYAALFVIYLPQFFLFKRWGDFGAGDGSFTSLFERLFSHGGWNAFWQFWHSLIFGQAWVYTWWPYVSGLAVLSGLIWFVLKKVNDRVAITLVGLLVLTAANLFALKFIYAPRYYIFLIPLFVVALAAAVIALRGRWQRSVALIVIMAICLTAVFHNYKVSADNAFLYYGPAFSDILWREAKKGDLFLVDHANDILFQQYYVKWPASRLAFGYPRRTTCVERGEPDRRLFMPVKNHLASPVERWRYWDYNVMTEENVKLVDPLIAGRERVWFINYLPQATSVQDPHGYLKAHLLKNLKAVKYYYFPEQDNGKQRVELILFVAR
ncbi:hypothetical protein A2482_02190 [Candidatus Falkowbacteria bacterium RIFOXYC2_FULL_48_21]|uniref:Glycosyltransferase RgtA/B/C/D-like domain-containing protein n=1 Tax=Candidatus Falkowbacteria bacterium RIFOXYC2_FULL_48_21 TaxID=1798005 RepID=A0A1F5TFE5_9BACT|nr:MAG: hypothetical protein A2482_02190 [Candidatus Falkowbacteria bacterium RIFOXYC2_FULL_48_21]